MVNKGNERESEQGRRTVPVRTRASDKNRRRGDAHQMARKARRQLFEKGKDGPQRTEAPARKRRAPETEQRTEKSRRGKESGLGRRERRERRRDLPKKKKGEKIP